MGDRKNLVAIGPETQAAEPAETATPDASFDQPIEFEEQWSEDDREELD